MLVRNLRISWVLLTACGCFLIAPASQAAPVTVEFSGNLVWVVDPYEELDPAIHEGNPGTAFQGAFTYDSASNAPNLSSDPMQGVYRMDHPVFLDIASLHVEMGRYYCFIDNDWQGHGDRFRIVVSSFTSGNLSFDSFILVFQDFTGAVYDATTLPEPPQLDDYGFAGFALRFGGNYPGLGGNIDFVEIIPEPSSGVLLFFGWGAMARLMGRSRSNPRVSPSYRFTKSSVLSSPVR